MAPLPHEARWAVSDFARALRAEKAAVFVGAGLSVDSGFRSWRELLAEPAGVSDYKSTTT